MEIGGMSDTRIFCLISLCHPNDEQIKTIIEYSSLFDKTVAVDDTGKIRASNNNILKSNQIRYIRNLNNEGLCKTINKGLRSCIRQGADWIVVMDQDSVIDESVLKVYRRAITGIKNNRIPVAAFSPIYNYDRHKGVAGVGYKKIILTELSGMMLNVQALKNIGFFDERFFVDELDYEWCLRARKKGYKIVRCNEAIINHSPGETSYLKFLGLVEFKYGWHAPERYYYQFRGLLIIHKEYHSPYCDFVFFYKIMKALFLFDNRKEYRRALIFAFKDYKIGYFGKLKEKIKGLELDE